MVLFLPWPEYRDLEINVTFLSGDSLAEVFLYTHTTFCAAGLEVLVSIRGRLTPVGITIVLGTES